jgi:hypothetical protein
MKEIVTCEIYTHHGVVKNDDGKGNQVDKKI